MLTKKSLLFAISIAISATITASANAASVKNIMLVPNGINVQLVNNKQNNDYPARMAVAQKIQYRMQLSELPRVHHVGPNMKVTFKHRHNANRFVNTISYHPYRLTSTTYPGYRKNVQVDHRGYDAVYLTQGQYHRLNHILNGNTRPSGKAQLNILVNI